MEAREENVPRRLAAVEMMLKQMVECLPVCFESFEQQLHHVGCLVAKRQDDGHAMDRLRHRRDALEQLRTPSGTDLFSDRGSSQGTASSELWKVMDEIQHEVRSLSESIAKSRHEQEGLGRFTEEVLRLAQNLESRVEVIDLSSDIKENSALAPRDHVARLEAVEVRIAEALSSDPKAGKDMAQRLQSVETQLAQMPNYVEESGRTRQECATLAERFSALRTDVSELTDAQGSIRESLSAAQASIRDLKFNERPREPMERISLSAGKLERCVDESAEPRLLAVQEQIGELRADVGALSRSLAETLKEQLSAGLLAERVMTSVAVNVDELRPRLEAVERLTHVEDCRPPDLGLFPPHEGVRRRSLERKISDVGVLHAQESEGLRGKSFERTISDASVHAQSRECLVRKSLDRKCFATAVPWFKQVPGLPHPTLVPGCSEPRDLGQLRDLSTLQSCESLQQEPFSDFAGRLAEFLYMSWRRLAHKMLLGWRQAVVPKGKPTSPRNARRFVVQPVTQPSREREQEVWLASRQVSLSASESTHDARFDGFQS